MPNHVKDFEGKGNRGSERKRNQQGGTHVREDDWKDAAIQTARDTAAQAGHKAEEATGAVASSMRSMSRTVREQGPHEGMLGTATTAVADTLESGGRYLEQRGLAGLGEDIGYVIRRNPVQALCAGIVLGFLFGRITRS